MLSQATQSQQHSTALHFFVPSVKDAHQDAESVLALDRQGQGVTLVYHLQNQSNFVALQYGCLVVNAPTANTIAANPNMIARHCIALCPQY